MTIKQTGGIFGRHPSFGDIETGGLDLSAISGTIGDTAVDIFVYDTRKDSDGGAWRKRTQGTSWYNEAASATRGSRKEFPAVAVIVAESNQVTIYDGDDPSLPMWMVFNLATGSLITNFTGGTAAVNGYLCVTSSNSLNTAGVMVVRFINDDAVGVRTSAYPATHTNIPTILNRNDTWTQTGARGIVVNNGLVNTLCNDVAMTVLPNAPIDAATGLPVPTIAVATDGGLSVIKDDGTVVDTTSTDAFKGVSFTKSQYGADLYAVNTTFADDSQWYPNVGGLSDGFTFTKNFYANSPSYEKLSSDVLSQQSGNVFAPIAEHTFAVGMGTSTGIGLDPALNLVQHSTALDDSGLVAFINDDHNTGWMNGNIKLATLSDTDDTDVTGSELVTNGTFDSNTDWTLNTGFSISGGELVATSAAVNLQAHQNIATTTGNTYVATVDCTAITAGAFRLYYRVDGGAYQNYVDLTAGETASLTFTALSSSSRLIVYALSNNSSGTFDNVTLRLAEEDRSVNGNGLQVFGTVTKNPVATGADLVGYTFSADNTRLEQPYNSDLDFGTGDFCYTWWMKAGLMSSFEGIFTRGTGKIEMLYTSSEELSVRVGTTTQIISSVLPVNVWNHCLVVRRNGVVYTYINGELDNSNSSNGTNTVNTTEPLTVGNRESDLTREFSGSLALLRASATAPSPEQIAKIYEDEKFLFQENAQATLYGSSDAVTALAYDDTTELLHVGTSAGRSVFQGLRRVENTTDAVGAAISASNGLVAED